jgi:geranylgeranylglycerol-phosphate geranylgeranyltransferase
MTRLRPILPCYNLDMLTKKIKGIIRLFRPELPLAAGICLTIGQILASGGFPPLQVGILGFVCAFALSSSALILNDYFDYEVDLINAPDRPLPSGAVTRPEVIGLTAVTTLVGLSAAGVLGLNALLISILFWWIGFLYNWRYKQTGLLGNLMVCASVGVTFILGAVTMQAPWNSIVWTFALMAFCVDLGEEIAGDAMDMEGDKKRGSRSIALLKGKRFALKISVGLWGLVILLSLLPIFMGWLGISYLVMILITDVLLVVFSIRLLKSQTPQSGRQAMRGAYLGATLGLLAFLIGRLIS